MRSRHVAAGQFVDPVKLALAKQMRSELMPAERILWEQLRRNRLHGLHFRRQQVIDGFIVDFYCHQAALVVELDGKIHEQQAEYDAARDRIIGGRGIRVMRVRNEEVLKDLTGVLRRIAQQCGKAPPQT